MWSPRRRTGANTSAPGRRGTLEGVDADGGRASVGVGDRAGGGRLLLVRHGQSVTNAVGLFTGWLDVGLTDTGRREALEAGGSLGAAGLFPDVVFTSNMERAVLTADLLLSRLSTRQLTGGLPRFACEGLIERHYGALTGCGKAAIRAEAGVVLFDAWRNSLTVAPPPLTPDDVFRLQSDGWPTGRLGVGPVRSESLGDVVARVRPVLEQQMLPRVNDGDTVLVVSHGNTLRGLLTTLCGLSTEQLAVLRVPTGRPLVFDAAGHRFEVE